MTIALWTLAIAIITAVTCALCGVFLVVKREALVCEGLSHAVLPGIIVAFVLLKDRNSPLLVVSAGLMGLLMILIVQFLRRTKLVDGDASLGIVFAGLFSLGIILASQNLRNTHFHAHCIIDGNLALSPMDTVKFLGLHIPKSFGVMSVNLFLIGCFIATFFKELKVMMFDETLAKSFGFRPGLMHVIWLGLVSLTTVAAFETAGSILVVALMITPPAAAYLLTSDLRMMLIFSTIFGITSAILGFYWGYHLNISPTGPMSTVAGILFLITLFFAPRRGLVSKWLMKRNQKIALLESLLLSRIVKNLDSQSIVSLGNGLGWPKRKTEAVFEKIVQAEFVDDRNGSLLVTQMGKEHLQNSISN